MSQGVMDVLNTILTVFFDMRLTSVRVNTHRRGSVCRIVEQIFSLCFTIFMVKK